MNIAGAKAVPLEDILKKYGHAPVSRKGADLWYLSPFRAETAASFVVSTRKNVWYDHGEGQGGTVIDLVSRLAGEPNVGRVLGIVAGLVGGIVATAKPMTGNATPNESDGATVVSAADVTHPALIRYLGTRGIRIDAVSRYLREVRYEAHGRAYFGLGFRNDSGGYEIRSERFKGCVGKKDITVLPGEPSGVLNLFEGFMDFLSWPLVAGTNGIEGTTVVLNSVALLERAMPLIGATEHPEIRCFFDTDAAGRKAIARLREAFPTATIADMSAHYRDSQDVNAELMRRAARRAEL